MTILFLISLVAGLVLAVSAMLSGVERSRQQHSSITGRGPDAPVALPSLSAATAEISAHYWLPLLGAFAAGFGAMGYILARKTVLAPLLTLLLATLAGAAIAIAAVVIIGQWAVPAARRDLPDDRYTFQGHLARVIAAIAASRTGYVAVEVDGTHYTMTARSIDGQPIPPETDVVIERIEGGVAYVESWLEVERRL